MKKTSPLAWLVILGMSLSTCLMGQGETSAEAQQFEALLKRGKEVGSTLGDAEIVELLTLGKKLGQVYQASQVLKTYLTRTPNPGLDVQLLAAENAYLTGDYRYAVARYKAYLTQAPADSPQAAQAAAVAYRILVQYIRDYNDAYQLMTQHADRYRTSNAVREYDAWYLGIAREREDWQRFAQRLAIVLKDKLPIEAERLYYWDELDSFMQGVGEGGQQYYAALPFCREIVPLIRDDARRASRYQLFVASLEYAVARIGKDRTALRQSYEAVLKAANDYFNAAPTGETLRDIVQVMAGGRAAGFDRIVWGEHLDLKQAFFAEAFPRIPAADRAAFLSWRQESEVVANHLATPEQWLAIAAKTGPTLFASPGSRDLALPIRTTNPALYAEWAKLTDGVASPSAAAINAMAAGKGDLVPAALHLVAKESWHLGFQQPHAIVRDQLAPAYAALPGNEKLNDDYLNRAIVQFGAEAIAKTPIAIFDLDAAGDYLLAAFEASGKNGDDKSNFPVYLHSLDWVPYTAAERQQVYRRAYESFKRWTAVVRRTKADDKAISALVSNLERDFQDAIAGKNSAAAKAPDELAGKLAQAVIASRDAAQRDAYLAVARELYQQVRLYDQQKTPFGEAIARFLVDGERPFDVTDFQLEVLADQLALYTPGQPDWRIRTIVDGLVAGRRNWSGWSANQRDRKVAEAMNGVLAAAITAQLDKGIFWGWAFDRFRATRAGAGWAAPDLNLQVMDKLVATKALIGSGYRPHPEVRSGAAAYMWLVENDFKSLARKYPVDRYFDDIFAEEAKQTGYLDAYCIARGRSRDADRKLADVAATLIAAMDRLPFGYGAEPVKALYAPADFWRWQDHALGASDGPRRALLAKLESLWGKTRFDTYAMGRGYFRSEAKVDNAAGRQEFFARLRTYSERAGSIPAPVGPPRLHQLRNLGNPRELTVAETDTLIELVEACTPITWWRSWDFEDLAGTLYWSLVSQKRADRLYAVVPHFWCIVRDLALDNHKRAVAEFCNDLMERGEFGLVVVHVTAGTQILGNALPEEVADYLSSIRGNASGKLGGAIEVPRSDPRYPIYQAQADYLAGNLQSAWEGYGRSANQLPGMIKELDSQFVIWLIERSIEMRDFDTANLLTRLMITWMDNSPVSFDKETRAILLLVYANISFAMEDYPRARAQYERIAAAREFNGTRAQLDANLKIAEVDRLTRQYDAAAERLEKLLQLKNNYVQQQAHFLLAKLKFDQEEFQASKEYLQQVFLRDPNHYEARILEGEVNLRMKRLMEATRLRVGPPSGQRTLIPGRPMEVSLEDQNLSVVGTTRRIEIRAWTDGGDEEVFALLPFGETKTKFQGTLGTGLGVAVPNNRHLELLGGDTIYYDFSPAFRQQHGLEAAEPATLRVATDAELYVSSGEILTKEQLEDQRLEQLIRRQLRLEGATSDETALRDRRRSDQVKPGNPVYLRLIDLDRSISTHPDTVSVRVETSSGDVIPRFELTESGPHTGIFEGRVPTGSAQATAYASDTREGLDPNYVISAGEYEPWVAMPDNQRPKTFSVDLNDNVELNNLTLVTDVAGRKITNLMVQTSLNGREWETVGIWPGDPRRWNGALEAEVVKYNATGTPRTLAEFNQYLETAWYVRGQEKSYRALDSLNVDVGDGILGLANDQAIGRNDAYLLHVRGAFWLDQPQVRLIRLDHKDRLGAVSYLFTIDGKPGDSPYDITRSFSRGLHYLDVYVWARRGSKPHFEILTSTDEGPDLVPLPVELFDRTAHPQIERNLPNRWAIINSVNDRDKLSIDFAEGSSARLVRFILVDFETDAPAIRKVTLTDRRGRQVLPTQQDFLKLKQNDTLEIVPGDRVTVTYNDPKTVSPNNDVHEGFLTATFSDATLQACFIAYEENQYGVREITYIPLRRFKVGDKVNIYIDEPDADVSDSMDEVAFEAYVTPTETVVLSAKETEEHSGVFIGTIYPVTGAPTKKTEIKVAPGDQITVSFLDKENTDPGIPWKRTIELEQAIFSQPRVYVYSALSTPITEEQKVQASQRERATTLEDYVEPRFNLTLKRPDRPTNLEAGEPPRVLVDAPLVVELIEPGKALTAESEAVLYVQTSRGRAAAGGAANGFDVNVPGTLKFTVTPGDLGTVEAPAGYFRVTTQTDIKARGALDDGRFTFRIPMELGVLPQTSLIDWKPESREQELMRPKLQVQGNDTVYIGIPYEDGGEEKWIVQEVTLTSDIFFDVMDRKYQSEVTSAYVGETIYIRVINQTLDVSDEKDLVTVRLANAGGTTMDLELAESFGHTGSFKGLVRLVFHQDTEALGRPGVLPVVYGDTLTLTYADGDTELAREAVAIFQGDNGDVLPFTKRYRDGETAVQTQFMIAEAYFEQAKKHHALGQESLARREMVQAKKLLDEAIRDNPDAAVQAQAEYLLANLAYESADISANEALRNDAYQEAVARFNNIVSSYPDSPYAPKAQYKMGLVFEKMGEIDRACDEYVKLSYRYPDNELVAETIARLGQYFLTKGKEIKDEADSLTDPVEKEKRRKEYVDMFKTAASVFGRLSERFPDHGLAGKTIMLSAQCYMRAEDLPKAILVFVSVAEDIDEDKELRSEAMYWAGHCHMDLRQYEDAYKMFKKLTWDYPETKWAKYARGRLTDPNLNKLNIE